MIDFNLFATILALIALLSVFGWHIYSNSLAIEFWWANLVVEFSMWRHTFRERAALRISGWMPRWLVYWCAIRLMAHATQGKWSSQVVPDLTAMDALKRWGDRS